MPSSETTLFPRASSRNIDCKSSVIGSSSSMCNRWTPRLNNMPKRVNPSEKDFASARHHKHGTIFEPCSLFACEGAGLSRRIESESRARLISPISAWVKSKIQILFPIFLYNYNIVLFFKSHLNFCCERGAISRVFQILHSDGVSGSPMIGRSSTKSLGVRVSSNHSSVCSILKSHPRTPDMCLSRYGWSLSEHPNDHHDR